MSLLKQRFNFGKLSDRILRGSKSETSRLNESRVPALDFISISRVAETQRLGLEYLLLESILPSKDAESINEPLFFLYA